MASQQTSDSKYEFTESQDWSSYHQDTWATLFPLVKTTSPRILEVGSWEGRSAVFFVENLCKDGGDFVSVDHFDLLHTAAGRERFARMKQNLAKAGRPFRIVDDFSAPGLMTLLDESITAADPGFDWIHIDGSHEGDDTFLDGELAWRLARNGSIIIFDDYRWSREPETSIHHPRRGIDAFLTLHEGQYEKLSDAYQMIIRKTTDLRLGFLAKGYTDEATLIKTLYGDDHGQAAHPLSYEGNVRVQTIVDKEDLAALGRPTIAFTVDSGYAMAAAVAVRSLAEHTSEAVTIYVIDCGLSESDKERIQASLPAPADVTLTFVPLPENSLTKKLGASWAKVDLIRVLPAKRVIYLDADILVRQTLTELWHTDMKGNSIAAVPDMRFPLGHPGVPKCPYFNAGVMLLDISKLRPHVETLEKLAFEMTSNRYPDQDALNTFSRPHWTALDLHWNAQGLGLTAEQHATQRAAMALNKVKSPAVVHFTGPVSPTMGQVLDSSYPYTEKPWSYAGAPGHPYREEWWAVLEGTPWKGLRGSEKWERKCEEEMERIAKAGVLMFKETVKYNGAPLKN